MVDYNVSVAKKILVINIYVYSSIIYLDLFLGLPVALGSVLAFPSKAFVQIFLKFYIW